MPKKKIAKKENKETPKKEPKKDRQFYYILGAMLGLIILFLIAHSIFQSLNKFEYHGLTFSKEKFGDIPLFHYYFYTNPSYTTGNVVTNNPRMINLYLRHDPRENNVPVEGEIEYLSKMKFLYISINSTDLTQCGYTSISLSSLTSFLASSGFTVKGAVPDEEEANRKNVRYITCENQSDNMVILIEAGSNTTIKKENNCYTITVANCEILQATEKFMVQSIIDARARQSSSF